MLSKDKVVLLQQPSQTTPDHPIGTRWQEAFALCFGNPTDKSWGELSETVKAKVVSKLNSITKAETKTKKESNPRFAYLTDSEIKQSIDASINKLNKTYTHIVSNGKNYIIRPNTDDFGCMRYEFFNLIEFKNLLRHTPKLIVGYKANGGEIKKDISELWLDSPKANLCTTGFTFYPSSEPYVNGKLNAYFGLSVEPKDLTNIQPYLDHLKHVICDGDLNYYTYLINWIAHLFQKPEEKPEVAIVLKAGQGAGKGTFVDPLGKIIGSHYFHATDPKHVIGRFNASLENKILLFADEFFSGKKQVTDVLKGLITEKTGVIERKGVDSVSVPSYSRLIMASNRDNIISIEKDERRYFYLEVSESKKGDHKYFMPLQKLIAQKDFLSSLLYYFLSVDITKFNPREFPKTNALTQQKLDNLDSIDSWLLARIRQGSFGNTPISEARINTDVLQDDLDLYLKSNSRMVFGDTKKRLGIVLKKIGIKRTRRRTQSTSNGLEYIYEIPMLNTLKINFCSYLNVPIDTLNDDHDD